MNPEIIQLLGRLVAAHEKLAENVGRIADQMTPSDDYSKPSRFVEEIKRGLDNISNEIRDAAPPPPEE